MNSYYLYILIPNDIITNYYSSFGACHIHDNESRLPEMESHFSFPTALKFVCDIAACNLVTSSNCRSRHQEWRQKLLISGASATSPEMKSLSPLIYPIEWDILVVAADAGIGHKNTQCKSATIIYWPKLSKHYENKYCCNRILFI